MADGRRTRWHSWDADFLGGKLGIGIRSRFGPIGIVVFLAFISACKRSHIQGQITYHTPEDALSAMSLPGLRLTDEHGQEWTLDTFWTYLGQQKVTSRRRRGDLTDIISTRWRRWQEDFGKQTEAEKKRRSRAGNTRTVAGRSKDENRTDRDIDNDIDNDSKKHVADVGSSSSPPPEDLFPNFWQAYPRRTAKAAAQKAWKTATKKADPAAIVAAAVRMSQDPNLPTETFIPHPATWLRNERWDDPPYPSLTGRTTGANGRDAGKLALVRALKEGA